ncbi:hypothetical protein DTO164E3_4581 [Paecilomyces variotii]|nr:hypothetical protein DTO164E3_4581 [Paecilomyces variotii]KAJ9319844.1 hypothetical protein DTO027B3_9130 [Paecilomyces variotii]KAJ9330656.1 hypothetical protein DTO027B5_7560 [Paecilomyces variotii]KAJ9395062.1 hypothetical protein DTO282F9_8050 [Paecilomyces variotii]KAJ9409162.1 hypothetical protein DTO045G8_2930 [Paecilomyces variotii]
MEGVFRQILRRTTPGAVFRLGLDGLGIFCACTLIWENLFTVQLSEGPSMYPTFSARGDYLLISRLHKHGKGIEVGDVVRFYHPMFLGVNGAKRVLGMPGDFVCKDPAFSTEAGTENEMIQVPEGHVYLAGDNLPWSRDSRNYGPVPLGLVNGKIIARVWPPSKMQWVTNTFQPAQFSDD